MTKQIDGSLGDDVGTAAIGEGNRQSVREGSPSSVVNNYIDHERERGERSRGGGISVDERLDRLERQERENRDKIRRIVSLIDGDPSIRFIGMVDKLEQYIDASKEWQEETEKRIIALEHGNQIILTPRVAFVIVLVGLLLIVAIYFAVNWLQTGAL